MKSETIGALAAALAKAQSEMQGAVKDAANPFFKSKYADLESVTLTDVYQPFKKPEPNGLHSPWAAMTPQFTFSADYLPEGVADEIEADIEYQRKWDADDYYKDATHDR